MRFLCNMYGYKKIFSKLFSDLIEKDRNRIKASHICLVFLIDFCLKQKYLKGEFQHQKILCFIFLYSSLKRKNDYEANKTEKILYFMLPNWFLVFQGFEGFLWLLRVPYNFRGVLQVSQIYLGFLGVYSGSSRDPQGS